MVKIQTLKVEQIKQLLIEMNLSSSGTKNELIQRWIDATGEEDVEVPGTNTMQAQIDGFKGMLETIMHILQTNANGATDGLREEPNAQNENVIPNEMPNDETSDVEANDDSVSNVTQYRLINQRYSVKETVETIPEFDPTNDMSLTAEQLVKRVNTARASYGWDEKSMLLAVYSKLKGVARLWLDASEVLFPNWAELSTNLIEGFGIKLNEAEVHQKMYNGYRKPNETIMDYCFRMCALGRRFDLSEQATIKYTRDGLRHRDLQAATAAMRFSSIKDMRETFYEYSRNLSQNKNGGEKGEKYDALHNQKKNTILSQRNNAENESTYKNDPTRRFRIRCDIVAKKVTLLRSAKNLNDVHVVRTVHEFTRKTNL